MKYRRIWFVTIISTVGLGVFGGGCGSEARINPTGATARSVHASGGVASITSNEKSRTTRNDCTSGCLPEGALSGGEKGMVQRNKAQFESFGQAADRTQRVAIILELHRYFTAIRNGEYRLACKRLSSESTSEFQRYGDAQMRNNGKACPELLARIFGSSHGEKSEIEKLSITNIGAIRLDHGHGYVLLRVSEHPEEQVMSIVYFYGRWLLATPQPYSLSYASPAS